MSKRDTIRTTSLGNVLKNDAGSAATQTNNGRWRSASDSSGQPARPKLFQSVREAMEHASAVGVSSAGATAPLDVRTLSSLEETQADEAGYTVIRRRAVSDLCDSHWRTDAGVGHGSQHKQKHPEKKQPRTKRSGGGSGISGAATTAGRRQSKRSPPNKQVPQDDPWLMTKSPSQDSAGPYQSIHSSDKAGQWLAAASMGAVSRGTPPDSSSVLHTPKTTSGWKSQWLQATPAEVKAGDSHQAVQVQVEAVGANKSSADPVSVPVPVEASLDPSMISWLENTLSLDEASALAPRD